MWQVLFLTDSSGYLIDLLKPSHIVCKQRALYQAGLSLLRPSHIVCTIRDLQASLSGYRSPTYWQMQLESLSQWVTLTGRLHNLLGLQLFPQTWKQQTLNTQHDTHKAIATCDIWPLHKVTSSHWQCYESSLNRVLLISATRTIPYYQQFYLLLTLQLRCKVDIREHHCDSLPPVISYSNNCTFTVSYNRTH